ncbi:hypothetical protein LJR038_000250 [Acidovorax sp. LjRoot38]|uniref:hypothetical protein n=1 Tax=Acidovorax sp. LjRoot38 TaxID=3342327 RepID=UPI003ED12586
MINTAAPLANRKEDAGDLAIGAHLNIHGLAQHLRRGLQFLQTLYAGFPTLVLLSFSQNLLP